MSRRNRIRGRSRAGSAALRLVLLISALAATAAAVWHGPQIAAAVRNHPYFAVAQVIIRGRRTLPRETILSAAGVHAGMSLWSVSPELAVENVEALARVRHASVRREFPNRVVIAVAERKPVAIAVVDGFQYVGRSGRVLGPVQPGDRLDLPYVTGIDGSHLSGSGRRDLRRALRLVRLCERRECGGGVSEVHFDSEQGLVLVPRGVPVPVRMGWGGWREKLDRMERVLTAWRGQEYRLAAMDVTFRSSVLVKLRQGEQPAHLGRGARGTPI